MTRVSLEEFGVACHSKGMQSLKGRTWNLKSNVAARGPSSSWGNHCRRAHNKYTSGESDGN